MAQTSHHAGLGQVPLDVLGRGQAMAVRHLDGHVALQLVVKGLVDNAKTAFAELGDHAVATQATGKC